MALETKVDGLMPRLHPRWKHLLLEESLGKVTGSEVARRILRERGRTDVKVCLSQDERNCYSPFLNLIGLSEDVAGSCSVMAVAIAAYEVGHALQARVIENFSRFLKNLSTLYWLLYWLSILGEMFMLIPHLFKVLFDFASSNKNEFQRQGFQEFKENQSRQHPKCYRFINLPCPEQSTIMLSKWVVTMLLFPINFLIIVVCGILLVIPVTLSICCALICRLLIFLIEVHASLIALRLLKQYKVLDIQQQKAARKFLLACALSYL